MFFTSGTTEWYGPAEISSEIVAPLTARPLGLVPTTSPFGTELLSCCSSPPTLKPLTVSAVVASATVSPATTGIDAYRPAAYHQLPAPASTSNAIATASTMSLRPNSHRPRNGPSPPRPLPPLSRCTTIVCDRPPSNWPPSNWPLPNWP